MNQSAVIGALIMRKQTNECGPPCCRYFEPDGLFRWKAKRQLAERLPVWWVSANNCRYFLTPDDALSTDVRIFLRFQQIVVYAHRPSTMKIAGALWKTYNRSWQHPSDAQTAWLTRRRVELDIRRLKAWSHAGHTDHTPRHLQVTKSPTVCILPSINIPQFNVVQQFFTQVMLFVQQFVLNVDILSLQWSHSYIRNNFVYIICISYVWICEYV